MSQNITFMGAVKACFNKYAEFSGRSPRAEFWYFLLFNAVIDCGLYFLFAYVASFFISIYYIYSIAVIVPTIAVAIRRMHDIGRSGWWILISLVPFIGQIWFFVLVALPSQLGPNQYGPNPYGQNSILDR